MLRHMARHLEWSDPPTTGHPRHAKSEWDHIADTLRQHPGRWAEIEDDAPGSLTGNIRSGRISSFAPAGSFDAIGRLARKTPDGRRYFRVWATYLGEPTTR